MSNRWVALAIIFASFIQFTLNWFCIIPAFGAIVGELRLSFAQVGGIVGAFIAGYGIAHIPGGSIAERYGMRAAMLLGIAVETAGAGLSAWAPTLGTLLAARRAEEGGSWLVRVSLAGTGRWLRDLGRLEEGFAAGVPTMAELGDLLETTDSGFGRLTALRHSGQLAETPPHWALPSVPLGTHRAEWV